MQHDPPPPSPSTPPPPVGAPVPPPSGDAKPDNGIAVAGLIVGLLATILSIVVIGGIVAVVGLVLSIIGLRRARTLGRGRGVAIGGIALSAFALLASIAAFAFIVASFSARDDTIIDGIASSSDNAAFPPQADLDSVECTTSDGGDSALAIISITNRSGGQSNYVLTVAWDDESGVEVTDTVRSRYLPADDSQTLRLFAPRTDVASETCRVTRIERSGFTILTG